MVKSIKIFINFIIRIVYNFRKTDVFTRTGSLAFTLVLSFIPFTISAVSIICYLPIPTHTITKIQHDFFTNYIPAAGDQVYHQVKIFLQHSRHLSILGFISLLITTYLMIFAIERQLNAIWHSKNHRKFSKSLLVYTLFLFCGPLLAAIGSFLQIYSVVLLNSKIVWIFDEILTFLITVILFTLVYKLIPRHKTTFVNSFIAATAATIIFNLIKKLFVHFLVTIFVNYHIIYGSLSFIPIFLVWIYISCLNLFFCAGIIYALETKFNRPLQHRLNRYYQYLINLIFFHHIG